MKNEDFKKWRESRGLTQHQAAEALGLARSTIARYEVGPVPRVVELACIGLDSIADKISDPDAYCGPSFVEQGEFGYSIYYEKNGEKIIVAQGLPRHAAELQAGASNRYKRHMKHLSQTPWPGQVPPRDKGT